MLETINTAFSVFWYMILGMVVGIAILWGSLMALGIVIRILG